MRRNGKGVEGLVSSRRYDMRHEMLTQLPLFFFCIDSNTR